MQTVVKSLGATKDNKALELFVQTTGTHGRNPGVLVDVQSAAYQIFTIDGAQVFPTSAGAKQSVDLVADRVSAGEYCALWDSSTAVVGGYFIKWFVVPVLGDPEYSFIQEFEVVTRPFFGSHYCSLAGLRDAGISVNRLADVAAQRLICRASRYVELFTGRTFGYVAKSVLVDGNNGRGLLLGEPIVALRALSVRLESSFAGTDSQIVENSYRIYNRHLTCGLLNPDDRENPRLEFIHDDDLTGVSYKVPYSGHRLTELIWPKGVQNCRIEGLFGYTEPDGSFVGRVPELVQEATRLMCFRYLDTPGSARDEATKRGRVLSEHTRDQGVTYGKAPGSADYTGDSELDSLLVGFSRPPRFGAA